jgi:hypothetical protein
MSDSLQSIRERAEALAAKARLDDTFAHALRNDPEMVLRSEGFTGDDLDDLVAEVRNDEVVGFRACAKTCVLSQCGLLTSLTGS